MEFPRIEVPPKKVVEVIYDADADIATIKWSDGTVEEVIVLELVYGPQGTWARLTPASNPEYVICITQSATMPAECYIVHEKPVIPEELPPELPPEEVIT